MPSFVYCNSFTIEINKCHSQSHSQCRSDPPAELPQELRFEDIATFSEATFGNLSRR